MKPQFEEIPLVKNLALHRFEISINDHLAFVEFREEKGRVALTHTHADDALKGTGAASALLEKVLNHLEIEAKSVLPYCPYTAAFITKHPEWKKIVDPSFPGFESL